MHKLFNESPWQATLTHGYSHQRESLSVVVIKAGYAIDIQTGALTPLKKKPAIEAAEQYHGEPLKSALTAASECSPPKVGGEFYILGATLTPPAIETTAAEASVALTLGDGSKSSKTIRAVGKRQWQGTWVLPNFGKPAPLTPLSLGYENAYGGTDAQAEANPKEKHPTCLTNYAGKGYVANAKHCIGIELPQLETPPYINSPSDRPHPAGFGPLPVFWQPRRAEQGTADPAAAERNGCTYGADAQATLHNSAPHDQRFPQPWQGGEILTLTNILSGAPFGKSVTLTLPSLAPQLTLMEKGRTKPLNSVCDTFWIDAKKNQLYLIYRAAYPMHAAQTEVGSVIVRDAHSAETAQREAA